MIGVSRNSIGNWEAGKCRPDALKTKHLSRCLNVSAAYLCGQTDRSYHIMPTPTADIDMSKLSTAGMRKLREYYDLLLKDENYRAPYAK